MYLPEIGFQQEENMFYKQKFILNKEKSEKRMYSAKSAKWLKYLIISALVAFALLIILANVKSKSYYRNLKASNQSSQKITSRGRSILSLDAIAIDCTTTSCSVSCSGDMKELSKYLETQKSCSSLSLRISDYSFPDDRLHRDWLAGTFNLSTIKLSGGSLLEIEEGAFDKITTTFVTELELRDVQIQTLTADTFLGLSSMETFTLINKIETFSGEGFLKPMSKKLKKVVIKHLTDTATDPAPWLTGGPFPKLLTIVFDGSNLGSYIKSETFAHATELSILMINSCKITAIADGAFDFMMKQMVVLVSLQSNQLTRLAGNYLTKLNSLRSVDIQFNPWHCNCELEDLIREYKKNPSLFGEKAACSTPPALKDKSLKDVSVESCADTTTVSSTLSPSPTTIPSTNSPSPTADENKSTPSSTTPTTQKGNTTFESGSSSSTDITTPIDAEISTRSTASTPTTHDGNTTFEPGSSSPPGTTTPIESEITTRSSPTTPSAQNRSTTVAMDLITIECRRNIADTLNLGGFNIDLSPPDVAFDIVYISPTCAQLVMDNTYNDLALIWFYDQPNTTGSGGNLQIVGEFKIGCQSDVENSLTIEGLVENRAYTFCLVQEDQQVISPFNCRSYYTNELALPTDESKIWLKCEDKPLTISLFVLGIIIFMCIGAVGMFLIIRSHPTLLKGNKRVIVVNRSTGDVLIMPKTKKQTSVTESSYIDSVRTSAYIHERRFSETSIQSTRSYMVANNYEDIEYRWKMNVVNDMIYSNRVPKSPPPPLPKRSSQNVSICKEKDENLKVSVILQKGNDYGYIS